MLRCIDASYYAGITNDLDYRLNLHNQGKAAQWTKVRRPVKMIYAEVHPDKSSARKREIEIKGWRRAKKESLFNSSLNVLLSSK
ncbi:MAG: GIY-YIG nuclease family protein [Lentisphaerae bacterium]|nr:GIY-YIG nuclease family protein [Lentisphaerota bacterium]